MREDKLVFDGKLLKLKTGRVLFPNGYDAYLEVVEHPGAALIVPFLSKDKIIMLKQYRPVIDSYIYELPAGTLEKNETHLNCAKREIIEETGYMAGRVKKIGMIFPAPGYTTENILIFRADKLKRTDVRPEEDEVIDIEVMDKKKVRKLIKSGRIVDAKTICALRLCGW